MFPKMFTLPLLFAADDGGGAGDGGDAGAAGGDGDAGDRGKGDAGDGAGAGDGKGAGGEQKPPWGSDEEFDPKRAWSLIENVRAERDKFKGERDEYKGKVDKHEDASKTEQQRLEERAQNAEARVKPLEQEVFRLRVALKKGLTEVQAKRLVGETEEDLEKDADELLATFRSEGDGDQDSRRRPQERLRPGAAPSADAEPNDPAKLAEAVPRGW